jgi:hypothetical protein
MPDLLKNIRRAPKGQSEFFSACLEIGAIEENSRDAVDQNNIQPPHNQSKDVYHIDFMLGKLIPDDALDELICQRPRFRPNESNVFPFIHYIP